MQSDDTVQDFEQISIAKLEAMTDAERDALPFGVIGLRPDTTADTYNATESQLSGIHPKDVLDSPFFDNIGQCMNNFLVAQRFEDEPDLDAIVPFVLTLRMKPTPVRLRLLADPQVTRNYILIER